MNSILLDQVRGPQREVPEREGQHLWRSSNYAGVHHSNVLSLACVSEACAREGYFSHWLATWRLGCQVCIHSCWGWRISAQPREFHRWLSELVESTPLLCQGLQFVLQRKARSAGPNLDPRVDLELSVGSCLRKISQVSFPSLLKFHKGAQSLVGPACFILKGYHPADHDEHEAEELGIVTSCLSFVKSCSRMKHSCHQSDLAASWWKKWISALGPDEAFCPCCWWEHLADRHLSRAPALHECLFYLLLHRCNCSSNCLLWTTAQFPSLLLLSLLLLLLLPFLKDDDGDDGGDDDEDDDEENNHKHCTNGIQNGNTSWQWVWWCPKTSNNLRLLLGAMFICKMPGH